MANTSTIKISHEKVKLPLDALYDDALSEMSEGRFLEARRKLEILSLSNRKNELGVINLCICYINLQQLEQARFLLENLLRQLKKIKHARTAQTMMLLTTIYLQDPKHQFDDKAMMFFEKILHTQYGQIGHFVNASIVYLRHKKYRRTAAVLRVALSRFKTTKHEKIAIYTNIIAATDQLKYTYLTLRYAHLLSDIDSDNVYNYSTLALNYYRRKNYKESLKYADIGLAIDPKYAPLLGSKATSLRWNAEPEEADKIYQYMIKNGLIEEQATWSNYALLCESVGRLDEALSILNKQIEEEENNTTILFYRAQINLRRGHFIDGFKEYQHRWADRDKLRTYGCKRPGLYWRSPEENLQGKSLYIHQEQGFGDSILYARYAMIAKEITGASAVYLGTQPELKSLLFQLVPKVDHVFSYDEVQPRTDYNVSLLSLPYLLRCMKDHETIFSSGYLSTKLSVKTSITKGYKIAIAWQGNDSQPVEVFRRIPVEYFLALAKKKDVRLFNVQPDHCRREIIERSLQHSIIDVSEHLNDFLHTAAFLNDVNLVITSCTALANLAGAMGKECWVVASYMADWRWGTNDMEKGHWYDSVRVIRQERMRDWGSAFEKVEKLLDERLAAYRAHQN